jgi:hypothetical protein
MLRHSISLVGLFSALAGIFIQNYYGDANRKIALSVRGVGLLDEEPENSPRRAAERRNAFRERVGLCLVVGGVVLQLIVELWTWIVE